MLSWLYLHLVVGALQTTSASAAAIATEKLAAADPDLYTWTHNKSSVNIESPVVRDEVRRSRKYNVSVSLAGTNSFQDSFVYETIPRNGNGKMYDPANPGKQYNLSDGDGVSIDAEVGINMAWSQFEYRKDVDVRITSTDGSKLGPSSNVVIRPTSTRYEISSPDTTSVVIRVPYDSHGRRFSVEFQNNLYAYRSNGTAYVSQGGLIVSEEPKDALVIFASPFISKDLIPSKTSPDTQVLKPGKIVQGSIPPKPTLYFEAGVYWVEDVNGILGKSHIKLDPNTNFIYFEPGTYIKGAFEYTTSNPNFYTIGHGIISGENYAYMANWNQSYVAEKSDVTSLRMISHYSVTNTQTWICTGPTLNAPPFNTVDLLLQHATAHEEDNKVHSAISDYKQVGAFYYQTDGSQIYAGTTRDVFWHANDDAIKLYHCDTRISNLVVWKVRNDSVIQMGWTPRNVSNVTMTGIDIIHNRWPRSETVVPSSILGASPYYTTPKHVDATRTIAATITDLRCEGRCTALLRIAPMNNYNITISNVHMETLQHDSDIKLGLSMVGVKISPDEDLYTDGQDGLHMGIRIRNWTIGDTKVDMGNWQAGQLGQLNINASYWGQWSIE